MEDSNEHNIGPDERSRLNLIAVASSSHTWLRELSQWVNGSLIDASLNVVLSAQDLEETLEQESGPVVILIDASNKKFDELLWERKNDRKIRVIIVGDSKTQNQPRGYFEIIEYPFNATQFLEFATINSREITEPKTNIPNSEPEISKNLDNLPNARFSSIYDMLRKNSPSTKSAESQTKTPTTGHAKFIGIIGVPGSGSSTLAMALAQDLGSEVAVLLVDLRADGDLAMYHDIDRSAPALGELMALAMKSGITTRHLRNFYQPVMTRNYQLIAGVKRQEEILTFRPNHMTTLFEVLKREFDFVIFDLDSSLRSPKLLDAFSDSATTIATETSLNWLDSVAITMTQDLKGIHSGLRLVHRLMLHGLSAKSMCLVKTKAQHRFLPQSSLMQNNLGNLIQEIAKEVLQFDSARSANQTTASRQDYEIQVISSRFDKNLEEVHQGVKTLPKHLTCELKKWILTGSPGGPAKPKRKPNERILPGDLGFDSAVG